MEFDNDDDVFNNPVVVLVYWLKDASLMAQGSESDFPGWQTAVKLFHFHGRNITVHGKLSGTVSATPSILEAFHPMASGANLVTLGTISVIIGSISSSNGTRWWTS